MAVSVNPISHAKKKNMSKVINKNIGKMRDSDSKLTTMTLYNFNEVVLLFLMWTLDKISYVY